MEATPKIQAIELGWGEDSVYFSTNVPKTSHKYVAEIIERTQYIGTRPELVYLGFKNNQPLFKIFAGSNVTVYYSI